MLKIFTLTWNNASRLSKLKESLIPALKNIDFEWFIKDNNSADNTTEIVSKWNNKNIHYIKYKNNLQNFSEGNNFLFNTASPKDDDFILLLNDDVVFNDNKSIPAMMNLLKGDVGVVGARLRYMNTNKLQHAGVVFNPKYNAPMHFRLNQNSDINAEKNREFQVVTGAVLLTKADFYRNICTTNKSGNKGMDEKFIWAFDDVDLCASIKYNLEKKIIYCGSTDIFHEESSVLKKNPVNHMFMNGNLQRLRDKWKSHIVLDQNFYEQDINYMLY